MTDLIDITRDDRVLYLTLNRPERKNAINFAMYEALTAAVAAAGDDGTRAIVFAGAGGHFTSGNDMADFAASGDIAEGNNPIARFIHTVLHSPVPLVAAVEGYAVGIGTTLLLHCDLVYAAPTARFRLPFANLGLCPEFASSYLLPRLAGHVKAAEWLMLGEFFCAEEACKAGLLNAITEEPQAAAREAAGRLTRQAPGALRATKRLMKSAQMANLKTVIDEEFAAFARGLRGAEFAEAATAFFEKRAPDFSTFKPQ